MIETKLMSVTSPQVTRYHVLFGEADRMKYTLQQRHDIARKLLLEKISSIDEEVELVIEAGSDAHGTITAFVLDWRK